MVKALSGWGLITMGLKLAQPEAVIDIHNTSGSGPSFAVTTFMDARHDALASLFTHRLIVTNLKLGALMEVSEVWFPTITIECGGAQEGNSHQLAYDGLVNFASKENILSAYGADIPMQYFHNPLRLELIEGTPICYGDKTLIREGLTLKADIEQYNFGSVDDTTVLGFAEDGLLQRFVAKDMYGVNRVDHYFQISDGELRPRMPLRLFMVTSNPNIATSDCLFYFIQA
jgi:hypothetical protein